MGLFGVDLGECVCVVCGTVWSGLGGVSVCCVLDLLEWIGGSECVLCVGMFQVDLGSECVLCVGLFRVDWEE